MIFLFSLIPATILIVVGYFVLFASTRVEGGLKRFGRYLGAWILFLAGVAVLGGLLASTFGMEDRMGGVMQHMQTMEEMEQEQSAILRELQRN